MANVYIDSAAGGAGTGADWANAYTTLAAALSAKAAGDDFWVASTHAESAAGAKTLTSPGTVASPCRVISVNKAGSVPPVAADITAGAAVTTTGANNINFVGVTTGSTYFEGITFTAGDSTSNGTINIGSTTAACNFYFKNCNFRLAGNNTASGITFGLSGVAGYQFELENCTVKFANASQAIYPQCGRIRIKATSGGNFIDSGGTIPTTLVLLNSASARTLTLEMDGLDLSAKTSGNIVGASNFSAPILIHNCRLNAGVTAVSAAQTVPGAEVIVSRTSSSAVNYPLSVYRENGNTDTVTNVRRNGGAAGPDSQGVSWQITTSSAAKRLVPFKLQPITAWNTTTGSSVTATIYGVIDAAAVPTNAELWAEFYYLGNASYPLATMVSTAPATILTSASNLTADTSDWDDGATARAQNTAYSTAGVPVSNSTNPGRIFFVKTTGTTANTSTPDWSATVDGGDATTDGTVVFRAGCRFKISTSFTPNLAGPVFARLFCAKASVAAGSAIYIDPKVVLS